MAKIELKQPVVEEIKENIKDAKSVVLVDYRGLTVDQDTQLRKSMREADVIYKVYKNTMVKLAIAGTEFESLKDELEGPTAVVISKTDATAPARLAANFAKANPALELKSGVVEGTHYDTDGIKKIATIPSRDELISKFLGSIQSPITNFARVIKQIAEKGGAADVEVEEIDWKIITDANAALSSFLAGDLDMVGLGTGELIKQATAAGATIQSYTDGTAIYIYFNNNDQYLSNVNLRRALFNAIDEQKEIDTVWQNDNEPMTSFTAPGVSAADGTPFAGKVGELYAPSRDQEKAKEYLATALSELGCTVDDLSAHLSIDCGDSATSIAEASFYQEQWRQVLGIEVAVNSMITKQGSQNRKTGNYVMSITGWGPDYNDPNTFLDMWVTDGGNNQTGFSNERYDELIDLASKETDLEKRESYFIECEQIIADQLPIGPSFWRAPSYACSDKIKGGMHRSTFQDINAVYVKLS